MTRLQQAARDVVAAADNAYELGAANPVFHRLRAALAASEQGPSVEELVEALRWIGYTAQPAYHSQGAEVVCREMKRCARALLARHDAAKGE